MEPERASRLMDLVEWMGAGVCLGGLYLAGKHAQLGTLFFVVLTLLFILTTRAFRTDRDALLEG